MSLKRLATVRARQPALWVFGLGLAVFAFAVGTHMLGQFDLPWHLAFGRQIVTEGAIPTVDSFSYAASEIHYISVLSDVLLYGLMQAGGPLALQIYGAAVAVALALILCSRSLDHGVAGLGLAALAMFAVHPWLGVRPATLTFVFLAGLLALIEVHRNHPTQRRGKIAMALALVMMPVWANSHGGAVVGVLVLFLYAAHRTLATYASARAPNLLPSTDGAALRVPWIVAVLAPILVLVNPAGGSYFTGMLSVGPYVELVEEWLPTSLGYFVSVMPAAGAFLAISLCIFVFGREPSGSRVPPLYAIGLVCGALMLITVKRFLPLGIVVLVPIVARRMGQLCKETDRTRILLATTVVVAGISLMTVDSRSRGVGWEPKHFPEAAVAFVEKEKPQGRMWNFWPYGGYLIWRLYPEHLVALDGRLGFVAYEHDYALWVGRSETDPVAFREMLAKYDLQWALCYARTEVRRSCQPVAKDPEWTMVYWDDLAAIYVRRAGTNRPLAERGYRVIRHLLTPEQIVNLALGGTRSEDISHDGALARAQTPTSTRALFLDAVGALTVNDETRFFDALHTLGDIAPYHPALEALVDLVPHFRAARKRAAPGDP